MVTVVQGMVGNFRQFVDAMGGIEKITVTREQLPKEQEHLAELSEGITMRDVERIRKTVPLVANISPEARVGFERLIIDGRETSTYVTGVTADYLPVAKRWIDPGAGRFVSGLDVLNMNDVIVLGSAVVPELFGANEDPVGKVIKLRGRRFTVIGVLNNIEGTGMQVRSANSRSSGGAWRWRNSGAFIPVSTAQAKFIGNDRLSGLGLRIGDAELLRDAVEQTERTMLAGHKGLRDFAISTNEQTLEDFRKTEAAFKLSLGGVAGISLFVGGIGIMNVMLASINERIREIGVRKAVGARGSDLFLQFLAEAAVISVVGGIIGLVVSMGIVSLMNYILTQALPTGAVATLDWVIMSQGLAFSVIVGLVAGVYPALRAAKLDPIEALRHE